MLQGPPRASLPLRGRRLLLSMLCRLWIRPRCPSLISRLLSHKRQHFVEMRLLLLRTIRLHSARGVRRFIRWTHLDVSSAHFHPQLQNTERSGVNRDADSTAPRRLTLQELSSCETRFYGKGQLTSIATTAPRGPPRRNGKKKVSNDPMQKPSAPTNVL